MKNLIGILACAIVVSFASPAPAQEHQSVGHHIKKGAQATGKAVKSTGKKVGEEGAKGAAKVKDKSLKDVKGPNGETVYIDKYQHKYYIDKNAKRIYLK